jgi:hypothetical protein
VSFICALNQNLYYTGWEQRKDGRRVSGFLQWHNNSLWNGYTDLAKQNAIPGLDYWGKAVTFWWETPGLSKGRSSDRKNGNRTAADNQTRHSKMKNKRFKKISQKNNATLTIPVFIITLFKLRVLMKNTCNRLKI